MSRTNIDIDDELIGRVMSRYSFSSKREAVDQALRSLDVDPLAAEEILALEGMGWEGDLDEMRGSGPAVEGWLDRD